MNRPINSEPRPAPIHEPNPAVAWIFLAAISAVLLVGGILLVQAGSVTESSAAASATPTIISTPTANSGATSNAGGTAEADVEVAGTSVTRAPTQAPTAAPTQAPTQAPTPAPTALPDPTAAPPAPEPTAEPTSPPSISLELPTAEPQFFQILSDGPVNARSAPGLEADVAVTFGPEDSELLSTGQRAQVDGIEWVEIVGAEGRDNVWVAADFLTPAG